MPIIMVQLLKHSSKDASMFGSFKIVEPKVAFNQLSLGMHAFLDGLLNVCSQYCGDEITKFVEPYENIE